MIIRYRRNIIAISFVVMIGYVVSFFSIGWNNSLLLRGDQWGYNSYLVSTFIYGDVKNLDKSYEAKCKQFNISINPIHSKNRIEEAPDAPNGNRVLKYFYGVAAMQAPFFLVAHFLIHGSGYSPPYVLAVYISTLFYVLAGLILLFQLLKNFVTQRIASLSILILFFCSNLFYFTVCNPGLSHPYLFFLFACLLFYTYRFYHHPNYKSAIIIGIAMGLIVVTRATEIIILTIPFLFGLQRVKVFKERIGFIRIHLKKVIVTTLFCLLIIIPQLLYWKTASGKWLYDTYPNEGFYFLHPNIINGLFSFKNGWLSYTPLMIFPLIFLYNLFKKKNPFSTGILVYILLDIYITYSWKEWYYGAGLGSRPMVQTYALLIIPLAVGLEDILKQKVWQYLTCIFLIGCLYLNILRSYQMQTGNFISEDATWQFNKQMLFKLRTNYEDILAFDLNEPQPDTTKIRFVKPIGVQTFESATGSLKDSVCKMHGNKSAFFTKQHEFNDLVETAMDTGFVKGDYIKVTTWAKVASYVDHYRMGRIVVQTERKGKILMWKSVRIHNKLPKNDYNFSLFSGAINEWKQFSFFVCIDNIPDKGDILKVFAWDPFGVDFWVDDLTVELFKSK